MPARRRDAGAIDSDHITFRSTRGPVSVTTSVHLDASLADQDSHARREAIPAAARTF